MRADIAQQYSDLQHWVIGVTLADPENHAQTLLQKVNPKAIKEPTLLPVYEAIKSIMDDGGTPPTGGDVALWLQTNNPAGFKIAGGTRRINELSEMGEEAIVEHNNISIIHEMLNAASYQAAMQELTQKFYAGADKVPLNELESFTENAIQELQNLRVSYTSDIDEYTHTAAEIMEDLDKELEDIRNGQKKFRYPTTKLSTP